MKNDLRKKYLKIRKEIKNKKRKDEAIFNKVINNEEIKKCKRILIYVSKDDEVDTIKLINYFLKNKKVAVPKILNNKICFYYIDSIDELKKGYFNILEPVNKRKVKSFKNCLSITPGVCFSQNLYRIGYGKGFYDNFYKDKKIYKIGLSYKECIVDNFNVSDYDIPMDKLITD